MLVNCPGRIAGYAIRQALLVDKGSKDAFRSRGTTDVAPANKEYAKSICSFGHDRKSAAYRGLARVGQCIEAGLTLKARSLIVDE